MALNCLFYIYANIHIKILSTLVFAIYTDIIKTWKKDNNSENKALKNLKINNKNNKQTT